MKKILINLFLLFAYSTSHAETTPTQLISQSKQLIVVTAPSWDSTSGQMQRYERNSVKKSWEVVGKPIPVMLGKRGMGWDSRFTKTNDQTPVKKEGDNLTPAGIYKIGPTFGFAATSENKMNYFPLTDSSICVDDLKSVYYNQLIDSSKVPQKDWNSGEKMRQVVPQYEVGAVVQYNTNPATKGAGSCIFLHVWKTPTSGTAGCIAEDKSNLQMILHWLNSKKNPVIAIFPMSVYSDMKTKWNLPVVKS